MEVLITASENIREEEEIVSGLQYDNQNFFSEMYDRYAPSLYGLILKWVKQIKTAGLLLHNTFIKAWHSRKLFDAKTERFYIWLCRLARICYAEHLGIRIY